MKEKQNKKCNVCKTKSYVRQSAQTSLQCNYCNKFGILCCSICNKKVNSNHFNVNCCNCKQHFHGDCWKQAKIKVCPKCNENFEIYSINFKYNKKVDTSQMRMYNIE